MPDEFGCVYEDVVTGELVVAGVFLRLFIANPCWVLRNPRNFMSELLDLTLNEMKSAKIDNEEKLETLTTALVGLLQNQPNLNDLVRNPVNLSTFYSPILNFLRLPPKATSQKLLIR